MHWTEPITDFERAVRVADACVYQIAGREHVDCRTGGKAARTAYDLGDEQISIQPIIDCDEFDRLNETWLDEIDQHKRLARQRYPEPDSPTEDVDLSTAVQDFAENGPVEDMQPPLPSVRSHTCVLRQLEFDRLESAARQRRVLAMAALIQAGAPTSNV